MPLGLLDADRIIGVAVVGPAPHQAGGGELRGGDRADEATAGGALASDGEAPNVGLAASRPGPCGRCGNRGGICVDRIAVQVADAQGRFLNAEHVGAGDLADDVPRAGGALTDAEGRDHGGERQAHRVGAERSVHARPQR